MSKPELSPLGKAIRKAKELAIDVDRHQASPRDVDDAIDAIVTEAARVAEGCCGCCYAPGCIGCTYRAENILAALKEAQA